MKKLLIAATVAAALAAGTAAAETPTVGTTYTPPTISTDPANGTSNGTDPMVLVVYDPANGITETELLGDASNSNYQFTYNDFAPANLSTTGAITFNVANFSSTFSKDLATDPTGSKLRFDVFGITGTTAANVGLETTGDAALGTTLNGYSSSTRGNNLQSLAPLLQGFSLNAFGSTGQNGPCNTGTGTPGGPNPCVSTSTSDPTSFITQLGDGYTVFPTSTHTAAALNSTIGFYQATQNAVTTYAGTWSFNVATGQAIYTVGGGGGVPLPAGVWLLLSGLGGLGVFGRRRAVAAA